MGLKEFNEAVARIMGLRSGELKAAQIAHNAAFEGEEAWRVILQIKPTMKQIEKLKELMTK